MFEPVKPPAYMRMVRKLRWPTHVAIMTRMPYWAIRQWLYSLDPKTAMLVSLSPAFKEFLDLKRSEPIVLTVYNWYIRRVYGFGF